MFEIFVLLVKKTVTRTDYSFPLSFLFLFFSFFFFSGLLGGRGDLIIWS